MTVVQEPAAVHILIVEDEALVAADLEAKVQGMGYTAAGTAQSGEEAVRLAESLKPDLVLMDVVLRGEMDGIEAAAVIREQWGIPTVFLTAYADTVRLEKARLAYPLGYLVKPFAERDLRITLEMALQLVRLDKDRTAAQEALKESEESYRFLFEHMLNGFAYCRMIFDGDDPVDLEYLTVNSSFESLTGLKNVVGRRVSEVVPGIRESDPEMFTAFSRVARTGAPERFEYYLKAMDMWLSLSLYSPQKDHFIALFEVITERKKAETELKEKSAELDRYFSSSLDLLCIADTDGYFRRLNPEWEKTLGYTLDELQGQRFLDFVHPEDQEQTLAAVAQLASQEEVIDFINRYRHKDGSYRWIEWRSYPKGSMIYAAARDITDRIRMETALEKRILALTQPLDRADGIDFEALFNIEDLQRLQDQFAQATGVASIITLPDGAPITKPSGFCRLCQDLIRGTEKGRANCYQSDAVLGRHNPSGPIIQLCLSGGLWDAGASISVGGRHIANWLIGQVRDETQSENRIRAYAREIGLDEEQAIAAFNDVPTMPRARFEAVAQALFTLASQLSTAAYQNVQQARFITERKRAEEKYQTLFQEMLDGFALHDIILDENGQPVDYRFLDVNPAFERLTGLKAREIVGRTVLDVLPGLERSWIEIYGRVALTGEPVFFNNYSADLKKHYEVAAFRPAVGQFACIFTDVTLRKRAEEEREKLREQLIHAQKMESVGRLAGGVAHDFNNMLGVILGHVELAQMQVESAEAMRFSLREIQKAAQRSADLTRQLLAFARRQTVAPKVLDLNDTIEGLLKMLRRLIGEDIDLAWLPGSGLWSVRMDPTQVDQILANLCVNARDAIPGVGKITIETANVTLDDAYCDVHTGFKPGPHVMIAISDDGRGMDKDTMDQIFEPFFTTKDVGKGTGLGLATVYGIVRQNEGFINVYSEPGNGSTFKIYLPGRRGSAPETGAGPTGGIPQGHGETILMVEDDPAMLDIGRAMLERLGYRVWTAAAPGEAIRIAEKAPGAIDLLLTDVVMPEMNGRELAQRLKAGQPDLACLFMSGYTANVIAHHGVLDEGVRFIQKPFSIKDLAPKVREALVKTGG